MFPITKIKRIEVYIKGKQNKIKSKDDNDEYLKPSPDFKNKIGLFQDDAVTHENSLFNEFVFDKKLSPREEVDEKKITKKKKKQKKGK